MLLKMDGEKAPATETKSSEVPTPAERQLKCCSLYLKPPTSMQMPGMNSMPASSEPVSEAMT